MPRTVPRVRHHPLPLLRVSHERVKLGRGGRQEAICFMPDLSSQARDIPGIERLTHQPIPFRLVVFQILE